MCSSPLPRMSRASVCTSSEQPPRYISAILSSCEHEGNTLSIFKTFDKRVIAECQWHFGHLPLSFDIDLKRMNFLHKLLSMEQSPAHLILKLVAENDLTLLCNKYNIKINAMCFKRKEAVWGEFGLSLQQ